MHFRSHRYPTRFPVTVITTTGQRRCKISNVNETGAKLSDITGLDRGSEITLLLSMGRARAIVQWVAKNQIGIVFRPHIPLSFVDAMRHGVSRATGGSAFGHGMREMR